MTLLERIAARQRTCRTPGCQRSTAWPRDPEVVAAYCAQHTEELVIGPRPASPEPPVRWIELARQRPNGLARDLTGGSAL